MANIIHTQQQNHYKTYSIPKFEIDNTENHIIMLGADKSFFLMVGEYDPVENRVKQLPDDEKVELFYLYGQKITDTGVGDEYIKAQPVLQSGLAVTAIADGTGGKITITAQDHGLVAGDEIELHGSSVADYNGFYTVDEVVDVDNFKVTATYTSTATATINQFLIFKSTTPKAHTKNRNGAIGLLLIASDLTAKRQVVFSSVV